MITSEQELLQKCTGKTIYLYGAGQIAKAIYRLFQDNQIVVKGFLVSRFGNNPNTVEGLRVENVYCFTDRSKQSVIVVATLPKYRKEVVTLLLNLGMENIIILHDRYVKSIQELLDLEKRRQLFENTGYLLSMSESVEKNHAMIESCTSSQMGRWRLDMTTFSQFETGKMLQLLKKGMFLREFEGDYGEFHYVDGSQGANMVSEQSVSDKASIYRIRSHVDKAVNEQFQATYFSNLQAGAALTEERLCEYTDNTGDNISERNRDFSECSAIYWIWKNGVKKAYTGVCHYRRWLQIEEPELIRLMSEGTDLINTTPCVLGQNIRQFFLWKFLYEYDWQMMMEVIEKLQPEYYATARKFEEGHFYLANNIFVMKTDWFNKMCQFVFTILLEIDRGYYQRKVLREDRYAGYLFELLYSIFVMHHAKELHITYVDMLFLT